LLTLLNAIFSNEELVCISVFLIATLCFLVILGEGFLGPILIAIVLAFLLQGWLIDCTALGLAFYPYSLYFLLF